MEVELPNGVVLTDVPEDATKDQIKAKAIAAGLAKEEDFGGKPASSPKTKPITSGVLMGIKDPISAGAQMLPRGLEFAASVGGMFPNQVSKFFGSEAERVDKMVKEEDVAYQQQRQAQGEEGFDWARLGGNVVSPANLAVGAKAAQALKVAKPLTQAVVTGAVGGAMQPVYGDDFSSEKTTQAVTGAISGAVGRGVTSVAGKTLNPLVSKAEQTMRDMGIKLTPGQLLGKQYAGIEDFARNMPLVGGYISDAKEKQLFQFNKAVINKTLNKVGEKLPEDVIGRDAIAHSRQVISDKYDDVLSKLTFTADPALTKDFGAVVRTAKVPSAAGKQELNDLIDQYIYQQIPVDPATGIGKIDGQAFKKIESDLGKVIQNYRNGSSAQEKAIGEELTRVADVLKSAARKQNPAQSSVLRRIDNAYGDLRVMETAAANGGAANCVFTPKQYSTAVRQTDRTRSKTSFAQGKAKGQDVSDAALEVMGPEAGSTLEGRLAMGVAGGYSALQNPAIALAVPVATKALYSDTGLKAIETIMRSRPEIAKKIGDTLTKRANREGAITGAMVVQEYQRATRTAEETGVQ
jgi:hypothetical protein